METKDLAVRGTRGSFYGRLQFLHHVNCDESVTQHTASAVYNDWNDRV